MTIAPSIIAAVRETMGLPGDPGGHRVVCAMSGGVDSSVAAALLAHAGYEVVGITLQLYDHGEAIRRKGACCAGQDIHDARRVAQSLGIAHYVLDFESRFKEAVIDDFVETYAQGHTPVPCIRCNQTVKFADLLARARALGAAAMVTGHYIESRARAGVPGRRDLYTPADMDRDQSYFLYATTQEQIDYLRFPLGSMAKSGTRRIAADLGLAVAAKPDSQDICFVPEGRYADIIARLRPDVVRPGDIVHLDGRVLGRHEGTINFTVGQRRGLGLSGGEAEPLFVVRIDAKAARIIVGPRAALREERLAVGAVNWLGDSPLSSAPIGLYAKIRSSRPAVSARLSCAGGTATVAFSAGEYGVSPGQACVFYGDSGPGARVLGGGTIVGSRQLPYGQSLPDALQTAK